MIDMPSNKIKQFLQLESLSGILLMISAVIAIAWANSPAQQAYHSFTNPNLLFWVNDALMACFFLIVGLELKRSFLDGKFESFAQIILPLAAAVGGMIIPALIYTLFTYHHPDQLKGWAIPVATDIAFALGVLSLFGKKIPLALKLFLLSLAIYDDIGAIIIIAIWYSHDISLIALLLCIVIVAILYGCNRLRCDYISVYLLLGCALWYALMKTGVHPTLAGVLLALFIPYRNASQHAGSENSPLQRLEENLHPWVAYLILPLFALANAGFSFDNFTIKVLTSSLVLGIAVSLFIGKQIGVFASAWLLIRVKYAQLPANTSWLGLYGVALLCGIGFTMSLFLGTLSFQNEGLYLAEVRLGVIVGSILSGVCGALVLTAAFVNQKAQENAFE